MEISDLSYLSIMKSKYVSTLPHFDFDADMDEWTIARAMAKEDWSQEYFDRIRK